MMTDLAKILPATSSGYIVGFRRWYIHPETLRLRSTTAPYDWPALKAAGGVPPRNVASNHHMEIIINNTKEGELNDLGIFADKVLKVSPTQFSLRPKTTRPGYFGIKWEVSVCGAVALWGEVEEHTDGWRAQYAYPLLVLSCKYFPTYIAMSNEEYTQLVEKTAMQYAIPTVRFESEFLETLQELMRS